jgi:hypothetical protein
MSFGGFEQNEFDESNALKFIFVNNLLFKEIVKINSTVHERMLTSQI